MINSWISSQRQVWAGLVRGSATRARCSRRSPWAESLEDRRLLAGFFQAPIPFTVGGVDPSSVQVADFNRDGRPDLAVPTGTGVSVLTNNGSGGYSTATPIAAAAGFTIRSIAVGDVNRDGRSDIVVTSSDASSFRIRSFLNTGATFTPAALMSIPVAVRPTISSAVSDLDRDGIPDFVVALTVNGFPVSSLAFLKGIGNGNFAAAIGNNINGQDPSGLALADYNGDGLTDVAAVTSAGLSVDLNTGTPAPIPAAPSPLSVGTNPRTVVSADLNLDGRADLAVASDSGVAVLLGDGTGAFPNTSLVPLSSASAAARSLVAFDSNLDGRADLATLGANGLLNVLPNTGAPSAVGLFGTPTTFDAGANPTTLAVADVNVDARPDLLVANAGGTNNLNVLLGGLDTAGPRVVSSKLDVRNGKLTIVFQDDASGLLQEALANPASYVIRGRFKKNLFTTVPLTGVVVSPPATANGPQTVVVTFKPIKLRRDTAFQVIVPTAGIVDRVGNRLDGLYNGLFPSGNGLLPTGDFVQNSLVKRKK